MLIKQAQKREDSCEVLVVGAGLVGAAIAAELIQEGIDTAILEAQNIAGGATGSSAGMVLTGQAGHYNQAVSTYGRQRAQDIWALTIEGRKRLIETADRLKVQIEGTGSITLAEDKSDVEALQESAELLQEDGFDVSFERGDPLGRGFEAALRFPGDVTVNSAALTRALLTANDVIVHEGNEVYNLEQAGDLVRVWARGRTVLSSAVVLAVNGYAPLIHDYFADKVTPLRNLIFTSRALNKTVIEQPCSVDYGHTYCRQLSDRRLLLGTWGDHTSKQPRLSAPLEEHLSRFAKRHFPEVDLHRAERQVGIMGSAADGLPLLGTLPDLPQVYFAVGFGGWGLAWSFVTAEKMVNGILHDAELQIVDRE